MAVVHRGEFRVTPGAGQEPIDPGAGVDMFWLFPGESTAWAIRAHPPLRAFRVEAETYEQRTSQARTAHSSASDFASSVGGAGGALSFEGVCKRISATLAACLATGEIDGNLHWSRLEDGVSSSGQKTHCMGSNV